MTKAEFVEMLTILMARSKDGVVAYYNYEDIGSDEPDTWASLLVELNGRLYVDDSDEEPLREGGCTSVKMYPVDDIDSWPPTLFERLSECTWWVDPEFEINLLDVIATKLGIP